MTTILFILALIALSFTSASIYRNHLADKSRTNKLTSKEIDEKVKPFANIFLVVLVIGTIFINFSGYFPSDSEIAEIKESEMIQKLENDDKRKQDSVAKIPKEKLVADVYKTINDFNDENEAYLKINRERLSDLMDKVLKTKYEAIVQKSIDSIDHLSEKIKEKNEIIERKNYETTLRNNFLDNNLNIRVKVSGKNNTKITLTYPLFSEVWFRKFDTEGNFEKLRQKGFKIIWMKDGYDYSQGAQFD